MDSLADAKGYLRVSGDGEDVLIERLISAASAYLETIGVTVDPMPEPVGEAILLMVSQLYRRTSRTFGERHDQVEGIGSTTYFDPKAIDDANWQVIQVLIAPYREISL